MKTLSALIILTWIFPSDVRGDERDLPIDNQLPRIGNDWVKRDDGKQGNYSWANSDNKKNMSEVLSFVAWKVSPTTKVTHSLVGQASIETFLSNGSAQPSTRKLGKPINEILRHRIVSISIRAEGSKKVTSMRLNIPTSTKVTGTLQPRWHTVIVSSLEIPRSLSNTRRLN